MDIAEPNYYMMAALNKARLAADEGEVPVGCVIVLDGKVLAVASNVTKKATCGILHAELVAIRLACRVSGREFLSDCDLYVTMEPCPMCAYAIRLARIKRVYFGCSDYRNGAFGGNDDVSSGGLFPKVEVYGGILEEPCKLLLQEFFRSKR